jgi:peptide-methionine (S)-S-oxide reductase
MATATFGAGCFWGVEAEFRKIKGVTDTAVGFMGGNVKDPSYKEVCKGKTCHAEVVQVEFDPKKVAYTELLKVFWSNHDPTQLNRQGPDVGTQYRSVIFYHTQQQKLAATASKQKMQKNMEDTITTEIVSATDFYRAEDYHQRYLEKRGLATC